jgi:hypothetical protein
VDATGLLGGLDVVAATDDSIRANRGVSPAGWSDGARRST